MESNPTKARKAASIAAANTQSTHTPGPCPVHIAGGFNLADLPKDALLDRSQAAAALGLRPGTLGVWASSGRYGLRFRKCGRRVFYTAGDLLEWLEGRARLHTGEK